MGFVATRFDLPTVTGPNGAIIAQRILGQCPARPKRGAIYTMPRRGGVIRFSAPRRQMTIAPTLGGFWNTLIQGSLNFGKGAAAGLATGNPVAAIGGGVASTVGGLTKGKGGSQQVVVQQQPAGPLANIGTGTIVATALGFGALVIALARR